MSETTKVAKRLLTAIERGALPESVRVEVTPRSSHIQVIFPMIGWRKADADKAALYMGRNFPGERVSHSINTSEYRPAYGCHKMLFDHFRVLSGRGTGVVVEWVDHRRHECIGFVGSAGKDGVEWRCSNRMCGKKIGKRKARELGLLPALPRKAATP
jgi:hypothetical protein